MGWLASDGRLRYFVDPDAVPDRPDPAHEDWSEEELQDSNEEGAAVPAGAAVAVGLDHGSETGYYNVAQ